MRALALLVLSDGLGLGPGPYLCCVAGVGGCGRPDLLLSRSWLWGPAGFRELQQIQQQLLPVSIWGPPKQSLKVE